MSVRGFFCILIGFMKYLSTYIMCTYIIKIDLHYIS